MANTWLVLTSNTDTHSTYSTPPACYASLHDPPTYEPGWLPLTHEPIPVDVSPPTYHDTTGDEDGESLYNPVDMINHIIDAPTNWEELTDIVARYYRVRMNWPTGSRVSEANEEDNEEDNEEEEEDEEEGEEKEEGDYEWTLASISLETRKAERFKLEMDQAVAIFDRETRSKDWEELKKLSERVMLYIKELRESTDEILDGHRQMKLCFGRLEESSALANTKSNAEPTTTPVQELVAIAPERTQDHEQDHTGLYSGGDFEEEVRRLVEDTPRHEEHAVRLGNPAARQLHMRGSLPLPSLGHDEDEMFYLPGLGGNDQTFAGVNTRNIPRSATPRSCEALRDHVNTATQNQLAVVPKTIQDDARQVEAEDGQLEAEDGQPQQRSYAAFIDEQIAYVQRLVWGENT